MVARTAVRLESTCHPAPAQRPLTPAAAQRLDLEHAVLMQELMALREERAELRSRLFLSEREKTGLELQLGARVASERALRVQLEQLRAEPAAEVAAGADSSDSAGSGSGVSPSGRRRSAQARLRQLSASLDEVTRASERRQQHAEQFIAELKRANGALADALEKTKRKYQVKLKRLEQQMLQIVERHSSQHLRNLKQKPQTDDSGVCSGAGSAAEPATCPAPSRLPVLSPAHRSLSPATTSRVTSPAHMARLVSSPTPPAVSSPAARTASPAVPPRPTPARAPTAGPPPLSPRPPAAGRP
ncbi:colorectal mutant cancer protein-like [Pollicipes pollicipes]|uniref:colorectal mutant cancer protein-like n=1 Tax=Pollicipes pollicipes TaxID=41117 RepID=UPI001884B6AB|nr:colorectal mutant cancer protein-like [Pollicipes pollicipes]